MFAPRNAYTLIPVLQEHRIRASGLLGTLEQEDLCLLDDMLLIELQTDVAGDIHRTPDMPTPYVLHLCTTSSNVALLGHLDCLG
jgi:hypothetical protein